MMQRKRRSGFALLSRVKYCHGILWPVEVPLRASQRGCDILANNELQQIGEQVVKKKRPGRSETMQPHTEPGDNSKYIYHSMRLADLPKVDRHDVKAITKRVRDYFMICAEEDMKPSVAGLALAFGVNRKTIWEWANEDSVRSDPIRKAYAILNVQMEDYMQNGKINPVSGIFLLKNNMGYTDKQEVVITPNALGETADSSQIAQSYIDAIPDVPEIEGIDSEKILEGNTNE